jgi:hypothetical protein
MLEVDIEGNEVDEWKVEVFSGWIVNVRDDPLRVLVLRRSTEAGDVSLYSMPTVPAHNRGGNLIADRIAEHGRMAAAHCNPRSHAALYVPSAPRVEKIDVVLAPQTQHDVEPVTLRGIEEPARRYRVCADRIDLVLGHPRKV